MSIYAVFFEEPEDDDGECLIVNTAFDTLESKLGKKGFATGQDNEVSCFAVDSKTKLPILQQVFPNHKVFKMTASNFVEWAKVFGEFDLDSSIEEWYKIASDN